MRTLTLIALLLTSTVQAEWDAPKHSADDMEETEKLFTANMFQQKNISSGVGETTYIASFSCLKQKSGFSRLAFSLTAYIYSGDRYPPHWDRGDQSIIIKVDDNAPFRMNFNVYSDSKFSSISVAPNYKLIQAFRAGNTARIRINDRRGNWEVKLDLTGFTRGSGPVIDFCG